MPICLQVHGGRGARRLCLGLLCALLALSPAAPTAAVAAQASGPTYVVQPGDTLYSIALAFGTSVRALQQANDIRDPSLLAIGQELTIPGFEGVTGTLAIHRVALGETLPGLAKRYGVTQDLLIRLNRITNPDLVYVGQPLIYPAGSSGLATGKTAVLGPGESLATLAARSRQTLWGLALLNDLASPEAVHAGQRLFVPAEAPPLSGLPQPFLALTLKPDRPLQGGTVEVVAQTSNAVTLTGQLGPWPLRFAPDLVGQVALQGIHAMSDPGLYPLVVTATLPSGWVSVFEQMVPVADGNYPFQQLFVGPEQSLLLDPNVVVPERERVQGLVSGYSPARQWQGVFRKPVTSERITTGFGWRRSYNGGPYDSYHDGIDWGMAGGSPVVAPAAGTVVLAELLTVRGHSTIIDHGWGVYTGYWHQNKVSVSAGQAVQPGDLIGEVGSSGLSTGSHLHFVVWVGGQQVNPEQWLTTEFP